ncbi:ATP-binding cassette domain-containing protein [Corynebacterium sp. P5848]|uniref:ABC transporter ATP-binding protein/permease n=1 Tax=Corynebacterium marambiense TaxID=2765364 RepID=UPI0022609C65|nr:ATP-binding cassette domain-containing protein [Corynebacterium marambiense]MCX7543272.1 ATP-binding cassette domain-containing protein [Corynebacterium marambiense]
MGKGVSGSIMKAMGAKDHRVRLIDREWVTDNYVRLRLRSDTLLNPEGEKPGAWIRAWFPDPGGGAKEFQRGYTIRDADPATGEFTLEFVLHEPAGPASHWARHAEAGVEISAMRMSEEPFVQLDPQPPGYLLLGDSSGYPAICDIAAAIDPSVPVVICLEKISDRDEQLPLPAGDNITATWIDALPDGQALVQAIRGGNWSGWYTWLTAEATSVRHARTYLRRECGATKALLHAQGYWIRGRAMGAYRDTDAPEQHASPHDAAATPATPTRGVLAGAKTALILSGIAQGCLSVLQIVPLILFAHIAQMFLDGAPEQDFFRAAVTALVVMGISGLGTVGLTTALHFYDAHFAAALRLRLLEKVTRLPLGWFNRRESAGVRKLIGGDVAALHHLVTHAVPEVVAAAVTPVAVLVYLMTVQWRLGLVLLIPVVLFIVVMSRMMTRDRDRFDTSQRLVAEANAVVQTHLETQRESRIFGDDAIVDVDGTMREIDDFVSTWQHDTAPAKVTMVMLNRPATVIALLCTAAWLFLLVGWIDPTDLIPFLILGTSFAGQLLAVSHSIGALQQGLNAVAGLDLLLATPTLAEAADRPGRPGHVVFNHVRFGYGPGQPVLPDFSLTLEPGTVTAIVGDSGAGKSTVAALLARLWDVDGGSISIDGRDIRDLSQKELYGRVSVLLQDVQLLHTSVAENIALAAPGADRDSIIAAAEAVGIADFIDTLPDGYDTVIDGNRLSGGQRQRIGVARALLADTDIVVLDEATASADPESEWAIRRGLDRLLAGKTVLMIAHRLHTVTGADRIVVMRDGRITESGTHDQLLAADGTYADLWKAGSTR